MEEEARNMMAFSHIRDLLKYLIKMLLIYVQRTGERGNGLPLCINNAANRTFVRFPSGLGTSLSLDAHGKGICQSFERIRQDAD